MIAVRSSRVRTCREKPQPANRHGFEVLDGVHPLSATIRLNRRTVMPLSPPSTSANRVAPSWLKSDRHLIRACSVKIRCDHGKIEKT